MNSVEALIANGWTAEGAAFLVERVTDPHVRKFVAKVSGTPYVVPRKPSKPKKHISYALRTKVFGRDAYRCKQCGDWHNLSIDHVLPESLGGTLDLNNLQTLCMPCNMKKGNRI